MEKAPAADDTLRDTPFATALGTAPNSFGSELALAWPALERGGPEAVRRLHGSQACSAESVEIGASLLPPSQGHASKRVTGARSRPSAAAPNVSRGCRLAFCWSR